MVILWKNLHQTVTISGGGFGYTGFMLYPSKQSPELWATQLNFAGLERQHGLPAGVLVNLVRQESGGDCNALSRAGAHGLCQFMPKTAEWMKVNTKDPVSSIKGAARYLEYLMDRFQGDPEKAIAAYNWGEGNLGSLLRDYPKDWKNCLPSETKNYLAVVGRGIGKSFVQRQADGEQMSADDLRVEADRRRAQLRSVGAPADLPVEQLLGKFFFAIFEVFAKVFSSIGEFVGVSRSDELPVAMRTVQSVQASGNARG